MSAVDLNVFLVPLAYLFSAIALFSGVFLVVRSFLNYRAQINRSMNMDLEIVRVTKIFKDKNEATSSNPEAWKEEIGAMEQLLTTLSSVHEKQTILGSFLYSEPYIALEIANPSGSEEISFYLSVPKKFRESIEKQVHSYFPNASIEKIPDYTIFSPGSFTSSTILGLKKSFALPVRTYEEMNVDPLQEISNALSKLTTENEGAAIQLVLRPAGKEWRRTGRGIAHRMQQGKQLKDAHQNSVAIELGKGMVQVIQNKPNEQVMKKEAIQLTPEEQELVKKIEAKSNRTGFNKHKTGSFSHVAAAS